MVILPSNQNNFVNKFITYHVSIILILPEKVNSLSEISQQNLKNLIQRYGTFLGGFYLEGSEYEFIIEERSNKPSMLTACFTSL